MKWFEVTGTKAVRDFDEDEMIDDIADAGHHGFQFVRLQTCLMIGSLHIMIQSKMLFDNFRPKRRRRNRHFDSGILKNVIDKIEKSKRLELCLLVTGTHLAPEYGLTVKEIEQDGYPIAEKIEVQTFPTPVSSLQESSWPPQHLHPHNYTPCPALLQAV